MARRLRQYYLGLLPQRTLCLISRPPQPTLSRCYIDLLPDEILAEIFAYLPPHFDLFQPPTYEQCPPIAIICKRWQRIYDTTLYRTISIRTELSVWEQPRASNLINGLKQRADLGKHVRNISVRSWHPTGDICRVIADIIKTCQATRTVSLHLGWSSNVWPIIQAIGTLPLLDILQLSGFEGGPSVQTILRFFTQRTLREIRLSRYGLGGGNTARTPWLRHAPSMHYESNTLSAITHSSSSAMTSLELIDPCSSHRVTKLLLEWPSKLVRLSLSELTLSELTDPIYGSRYTREAVEQVLGVHRDSLQYIKVGEFDHWGRSGIPDLSKFPCLHELHMSAHNILAEKPSEAAAKLASPTLRHLALSFDGEHQFGVSYKDFSEN